MKPTHPPLPIISRPIKHTPTTIPAHWIFFRSGDGLVRFLHLLVDVATGVFVLLLVALSLLTPLVGADVLQRVGVGG